MIFELTLLLIVMLMAAAVFMKDLVHAVIIMASAEMVMALSFILLAAPDVAITQAAISAGLTSLIFIIAISKTLRREDENA